MYFKGTVNRNVDVYWKVGSYLGSEANPGDWTLLGTVNVTPGGDGTLTSVPLGGITIPAGQTYGFKFWDGGVGGSDGPGFDLRSGGTAVSDASLAMFSDRYSCYGTFDPPFPGWGWQGVVYYTSVQVPAAGKLAITMLFVSLLVALAWAVFRRP